MLVFNTMLIYKNALGNNVIPYTVYEIVTFYKRVDYLGKVG